MGHAGRKGSQHPPALGGKAMTADEGGWETVGPSAIPFSDYPAPRELTKAEIQESTAAHVRSVERAQRIGFDLIQLPGRPGYLLHQFLSPLSKQRPDEYGDTPALPPRSPRAPSQATRPTHPAP